MCIECCGRVVGAVAKPSLNLFHRYAVAEQQTGTAMAKFVERNFSQPILFEKKSKVRGYEVRFDWLTDVVHINIVTIKVTISAKRTIL